MNEVSYVVNFHLTMFWIMKPIQPSKASCMSMLTIVPKEPCLPLASLSSVYSLSSLIPPLTVDFPRRGLFALTVCLSAFSLLALVVCPPNFLFHLHCLGLCCSVFAGCRQLPHSSFPKCFSANFLQPYRLLSSSTSGSFCFSLSKGFHGCLPWYRSLGLRFPPLAIFLVWMFRILFFLVPGSLPPIALITQPLAHSLTTTSFMCSSALGPLSIASSSFSLYPSPSLFFSSFSYCDATVVSSNTLYDLLYPTCFMEAISYHLLGPNLFPFLLQNPVPP